MNGSLSITVVLGGIPVINLLATATLRLHLDLSVLVLTDISPPSALKVSLMINFRFFPSETIFTLKFDKILKHLPVKIRFSKKKHFATFCYRIQKKILIPRIIGLYWFSVMTPCDLSIFRFNIYFKLTLVMFYDTLPF